MSPINRDRWGQSGYTHAHDTQILPIGFKCNDLTITEFMGSNKHSKHIYQCSCACGGSAKVVGSVLKCKRIKGCTKCQRSTKQAHSAFMDKYYLKNRKRIETVFNLCGQYPIEIIADYVGRSRRTTIALISKYYQGVGKGAPGVPKSLAHRQKISIARQKYWGEKNKTGGQNAAE